MAFILNEVKLTGEARGLEDSRVRPPLRTWILRCAQNDKRSGNDNRSGSRRLVRFAAVFALCVGCAFATDGDAAVATVNGDAVTQREFVEALRRLRARIPDAAALRQAALDDCVRF